MSRAATATMLLLSFALVGSAEECARWHREPAACIKEEHIVYGLAAKPWDLGREKIVWKANGGEIRTKDDGTAVCVNDRKFESTRRKGVISYDAWQTR